MGSIYHQMFIPSYVVPLQKLREGIASEPKPSIDMSEKYQQQGMICLYFRKRNSLIQFTETNTFYLVL